MSKPLTDRAKKISVETIVDDILTTGVDYMTVAEAVADEFPGLSPSDEDLEAIHMGVRVEMTHAHELWVDDE